jgi:hypothetical protein
MSQTDIESALTPDEWREMQHVGRYATFWRDYGPDRIDVTPVKHSPHVCSIDYPDDLHALVALASAALPDDDPRKITREEVEVAKDIAEAALAVEGDDRKPHGAMVFVPDVEAAALLRLAAKLAALLPPE